MWTFNWAGRLLASASDAVAVWEVSSGKQLAGWSAQSWGTAIAFQPGAPCSPPATTTATCASGTGWKRSSCSRLQGHRHPISAIAFSLDGKRLATACENRTILLWDVASGQQLGALDGPHRPHSRPGLAPRQPPAVLGRLGHDRARVGRGHVAADHPPQHPRHAGTRPGDQRRRAAAGLGRLGPRRPHLAGRTLPPLDGAARAERRGVLPGVHTRRRQRQHAGADAAGLGNPGSPDSLVGQQSRSPGDSIDPLLSRTIVAVGDGKRLYSLGAGTDLRVWDVATGEPALALEGDPVLRSLRPQPRWPMAGGRPRRGPRQRRPRHAGPIRRPRGQTPCRVRGAAGADHGPGLQLRRRLARVRRRPIERRVAVAAPRRASR